MPYPGGKAGAGVYQRIINQIPPHDVYVEAFLGDGAVLRNKRPAARTIGIEINPQVAEYFAAEFSGADRGAESRDDGSRRQIEVHCCCGIEWLKHTFGLFRILPPNPATVDAASRSLAAESNGRARGESAREASHDSAASAEDAGFRGPVRTNVARSGPSPFSAASAGACGSCDDRSCGDESSDGTRWFVYLDPPYLLSTRRTKRPLYRYELTEEQHVDLLGVANRLPCPVAISGYDSLLYRAALQDWRRIEFQSMTRGGKPATEVLWMNYPPPASLHDYRHLGGEKRERERITRKVRTWAAGLRRLPPLERQAILAALK